uniref:Uncharacterized protein n=1 Tax=Anguilla anguilla TaxID=7936 RepID=A0A0E9TV75_ANGAN
MFQGSNISLPLFFLPWESCIVRRGGREPILTLCRS